MEAGSDRKRRVHCQRNTFDRPGPRAPEQCGAVRPGVRGPSCQVTSQTQTAPVARMNIRNPRPVGIPGYRLVRWLGASGAATVYAGAEVSSGQPAAIKVFHRVDVEGLARLEQLLQANALLSHPNIVGILEIGRTGDGRLFFSMPLLLGFGQARHDLLGRPRKVDTLLCDLLGGLEHGHRCGTVHGDIKPSNVLFDKQGRAQLADFGIACGLEKPGLLRTDATRYLSPEQVRGSPPDPRSDVYGIGVLAYELLSGTPWLPGRGTIVSGAQVRQAVPRLPPGTSAWQAWIERALAPSPEQRFQNTQEMVEGLGGIVVHRGRGHAAGTRQPRRSPKWKLPAAVMVMLVVALAGWAVWEHQLAPATGVAVVPAAATVENPVFPAAVAPLAPAQTVAADAGSLPAERAQALIAAADSLRVRGHLFSPPFDNAASHYLAALAFDPGNPAANAGITALLATLRNRLDRTWNDKQGTVAAVGALKQGDELARYADASAHRAWRNYRRQLARRVGAAVTQAARAHDSLGILALEPLAQALPARLPAGFDFAAAGRAPSRPIAGAPTMGQHLRDPHGPLLVYVPAVGKASAFAIARVEVTRADYAAFARATYRPPARCLAAHNPFSRLRHLTWQSPGFAQGGNQPVVCVSWDDAAAYVAWLAKKTGQDYRLPSSSEWLRAARGMPKGDPCKLGNVDDASRQGRLDNDRWSCDDGVAQTAPVGHYAASGIGAYDMYGNVSEWLAGGSGGSRPFRGLSWRDGSHESPLGSHGTADSDIGYTSVGFRVVRMIDPAHSAPRIASSH